MQHKNRERIYAMQILLSFLFVIMFYFSAYLIIMVWKLIEDEIFFYNHFLVGFYQWIYMLPLIFYLRKRKKPYFGFLIGGIALSLLNIGLFVWIFIDPSFFF